jgi:MFS family permease
MALMTSRGTPEPVHHTPREVLAAILHPAVVVGALGYFVDIYDLILFAVVRVSSLKSLGYAGDQLVTQGTWLINVQMAGMLIGGVLWGLLGDRVGRIKVLFGSIILYSLANIANGLVHGVEAYALCRFLAGLGLAGELGGCVTLVSEVLPRTLRGYGTVIISAVGILGAVAAGSIGTWFDWRIAYYVGGGLGILLLFLRMAVVESGLFQNMNATNKPPFGSQLRLLFTRARLGRFLACISPGPFAWYFIGLLVFFSPEFAKALNATGPVAAPVAVALSYTGLSLGSLIAGGLSQALRSRKSVLLGCLIVGFVLTNVFFFLPHPSPALIYTVIFLLGLAFGYWAIFVTIAAEHFGTNMRATVATTVPNFARGSLILITNLFAALKPSLGLLHGGLLVGWICFAIALVGWFGLKETFHDDLDYLEE